MSLNHSLDDALKSQQGSLLIGVLVLVVAMTLIGIGLYEASVIEIKQIARTESEVRAFYAADAGIQRAALDVADPDPVNLVGVLQFTCNPPNPGDPNCVKDSLPNDSTTLRALSGFGSTCFGGATCDSSVQPYRPAYMVQARNDPGHSDRFWLVSTSCTPGPASNPCPPNSKTAQVEALILKQVQVVNNIVPLWGAFGSTALGMGGNGAEADSYDSHKAGCYSAGPPEIACAYGGSNIGNNGDIGSNGSIDLTSTITIRGDIVNTTNVVADPSDISIGSSVTVTGNVQTGGTVTINGVTNPNGQSGGNGTGTTTQVSGTVLNSTASSPVVMEPLPNCGGPFSDLTGKVTQYKNNGGTCDWTTEIAPTWKYGGTTGCGNCGVTGSKGGEFVAGGGACISFAPASYCLGDVTFSGGTWVQVTDRTVFTVDGQFTLSGGGFANTSQFPQNLQIISTYGNDAGETKTGVTISGGSDTYGVVYAPTTLAVISGGGDLYGSVMANRVSFTGGSGVHFDEFLATGNANLGNGTTNVLIFRIAGWKRVECGPSTFAC